jgi:hypothetical protein
MSATLRDLNETLTYYIETGMDNLEYNRRRNIILQHQELYKAHRDFYEQEVLTKTLSFNKEAQSLSKLLEEGNKDEVSLLINKRKKCKKVYNTANEDVLEEFAGLIQKIKIANKEIENELHNQNPVIDELEYDVQNVEGRITRTEGRLDIYLKKNSNCCLYTVILLEIFIIILAVSLL